MKWLTTIVLLEMDGSTRQKHVLPLDLKLPGQKKLLTDMLVEMLECGMANLANPEHQIRLKLWTRTEAPMNSDPWDQTSIPSQLLPNGFEPEESPTACPPTSQPDGGPVSGDSSPNDKEKKGGRRNRRH